MKKILLIISVVLYLSCMIYAVDIPLRIVSGVNSRSARKPMELAKGTIVWLDRYDFNSALWVKKKLVSDENDICVVYKSDDGSERILPRTIINFGSIPNKNRLFFKLVEPIEPFGVSNKYFIRLGKAAKSKCQSLGEAVIYKSVSGLLKRNIKFSKISVAGIRTIRIEFRLSVLEVEKACSVLEIVRGNWIDDSGKVIGKFSKYVSPNPSGFFDVMLQKDVPVKAECFRLDIGLPKGTKGKVELRDLLILRGVLPNTGCWQPRVAIVGQRFCPKIEIYTHKGIVSVDDELIGGLKITDKLADIKCDRQLSRFVRLDDEGFVIQIEPERLILVAKDERGKRYGRTYIERLKNKNIASQIIVDWPENRYRLLHVIVWMNAIEEFFEQLDRYIKLCYENRMNGILLQSSAYWRIGERKYADALSRIHQKIRRAGLDVVPLSWNFRDPVNCKDKSESFNLSAGKWVRNEKYIFRDSDVLLRPKYDGYPNGQKIGGGYYPIVLLTENSRFELRRNSGELLKEGKDYLLAGGWHNGEYRPVAFRRLPDASVSEGITVYASYNYLARIKGASPYWRQTCLSEPEAYRCVEKSVKVVADKLNPRFYHIGADEIITINRDSRDIVRNLSAGEIYSDYIKRVYDIIKRYDSRARVLIWGDAANRYHARGWIGSRFPDVPSVVVREIPKDIIAVVWSADYMDEHRIIDWFGGHKFCVWGGGGYLSIDKSVKWARELSIARDRGYCADGYIFTEWQSGDYLGLSEISRYIWSSPVYYRIIDKHVVCVYDTLSLIKESNLMEMDAQEPNIEIFDGREKDNVNFDVRYYRIDLTGQIGSRCIKTEDEFGFVSKIIF